MNQPRKSWWHKLSAEQRAVYAAKYRISGKKWGRVGGLALYEKYGSEYMRELSARRGNNKRVLDS